MAITIGAAAGAAMPSRSRASARWRSAGLGSACEHTAPRPASASGQSAPTAKKRVAMPMPNQPLAGSCAMIDHVMLSSQACGVSLGRDAHSTA